MSVESEVIEVAFLALLGLSLWMGLKNEKIVYGYRFGGRLYADREGQPKLFWSIISFHIIFILLILDGLSRSSR